VINLLVDFAYCDTYLPVELTINLDFFLRRSIVPTLLNTNKERRNGIRDWRYNNLQGLQRSNALFKTTAYYWSEDPGLGFDRTSKTIR